MNHAWKEHIFDCDGVYDGIRTCVQTWICRKCEKQISLAHGMVPCIDGICIDTREHRKQKEITKIKLAEKFQQVKRRVR